MKLLGFIAAALWASVATADIPRAYRVVALETAVPVGVLYAVALQESRAALGRGVENLGLGRSMCVALAIALVAAAQST